jgi:hypothetical protein
VVDYIIEENEPLTLMEKPSFRNILAVVTFNKYKPICYRTIRKRILERSKWSFNFNEYKQMFGKPSTTVDIWSSKKRRGYMAVSVHLHGDAGLDTKVLEMGHISPPHTAINIKRLYDQILAENGLDPVDTFKTVSDNAANMKKAFRVSLWDEVNEE